MSEREDGFYWVKREDLDWEIAEYANYSAQWYLTGADPDRFEYFDNDFEQIDERRIVRPDPEASV